MYEIRYCVRQIQRRENKERKHSNDSRWNNSHIGRNRTQSITFRVSVMTEMDTTCPVIESLPLGTTRNSYIGSDLTRKYMCVLISVLSCVYSPYDRNMWRWWLNFHLDVFRFIFDDEWHSSGPLPFRERIWAEGSSIRQQRHMTTQNSSFLSITRFLRAASLPKWIGTMARSVLPHFWILVHAEKLRLTFLVHATSYAFLVRVMWKNALEEMNENWSQPKCTCYTYMYLTSIHTTIPIQKVSFLTKYIKLRTRRSTTLDSS